MNQRSLASNLGASIGLALTALIPATTLAEPPPAVDVVIRGEPPPRRILTIEYSPLPILIGKISANIVIAPLTHHALVLNPFYVNTETNPIYVFDDTGNSMQLPKQKFAGFGGELGYRYYAGEGGIRGFFIGPSAILARLTATAQDRSETRFLNYGFAADLGYQALVADRVSLSVGGGVQYTKINKSIPDQQFPAKFFANGGVRPRLLLSLGVAF